jgi:hypothetical protein
VETSNDTRTTAPTTAPAAEKSNLSPRGRLIEPDAHIADDHLRRVLAGEEFLVFDGAMGTQLQARGLAAGETPELLCLTNPREITQIHRAYVEAGCDVVTTNTFGASAPKLAGAATVEEVFSAAVACARESGARYVAADIGPTGALLEPMGTLSFDEAYDLLISSGFKNVYGDDSVKTESSKSAFLIAPSGFGINLIEHVRR